ncbi:MAG: hypothetical protein P857_136 [Candidatus Xenolissoclinum pacificiensis L6]|uniref:Uncharacterized protein n=1 Tax=Candidatus Xenolissoclinum pacificiensis L6 TaxID=1401685 RepID=W2UY65_9RICK|nr:MAG: hypothetical protein P857_136 [Candidatus Xenolissoclinum pacificiensis L6]
MPECYCSIINKKESASIKGKALEMYLGFKDIGRIFGFSNVVILN